MKSADRLIMQTQVENDILRLNPDFDDAAALVAAIHASLKARYPAEQLWDCDHYFEMLDKALERGPSLDPEIDECAAEKDDALKEWQ